MNPPTALRRHQSGTALDLRSITRGQRQANWLAGRSKCLWIDRWIGRAALRVARLCGMQIDAAWPGPVWAEVPFGAPLLSWFIAPVDNAGPDAFVKLLNTVFEQDRLAGTSPDLARLMRRVLQTQATRGRHNATECPSTLSGPRLSTRVLFIDEREYSQGTGAIAVSNDHKVFARMVDAARTAHPNAGFWLARSADNASGNWLSSFDGNCLPPDTHRLGERESLCSTLDYVDHVYTIGASEGMHALLADKPVHVFGAPYYAGWGLTKDDRHLPGRSARPTLAALFEIVFLRLAHYLNPATHAPGTLDELLDAIEAHEAVRRRFSDLRRVVGIRFQWWKRPFATPYLTAGGGTLRWVRDAESALDGEHAALWGARSAHGVAPHVPQIRIEDGFLHSLGLGSDLIAPHSQVIDRRGLYFDPAQPSDLTVLLNETEFGEIELRRAAALREQIVQLGLTKYNLGRRKPTWAAPAGKEVLLVPGQVADDASIRLGTRGITTADALLREVRDRRPDAFIVYKPHPDALSGNRSGLIDARLLADIVDTSADLLSLIDAAHEVHTLSSLAGFEALLRGKAVFTYGLPFYAGWGLTHDALTTVPWRERHLSLDMLTAGVLLRYPVYWDWRVRLYTTPEAVLLRLAPKAARPLDKIAFNRLRPFLKALRWIRNVLRYAIWCWEQRKRENANMA
jgi:capsular polysaccharide export protein